MNDLLRTALKKASAVKSAAKYGLTHSVSDYDDSVAISKAEFGAIRRKYGSHTFVEFTKLPFTNDTSIETCEVAVDEYGDESEVVLHMGLYVDSEGVLYYRNSITDAIPEIKDFITENPKKANEENPEINNQESPADTLNTSKVKKQQSKSKPNRKVDSKKK